jgi:hypothetical protein
MQSTRSCVLAVAGRRIDLPSTSPPRFPSAKIANVREQMAELFESENAVAIVTSAACGADLIALEEAERLNIRRRIILPFAADEFRGTSVIDRGEDWGPVFDRLIATAARQGDLVILDPGTRDHERAYVAATKAVINQAKALAKQLPQGPHRLVAVIAWDGGAKSGGDNTRAFRRLARTAGFDEEHIIKTN